MRSGLVPQLDDEHEPAPGVAMLLVETSSGVMVRQIPAAAALQPDRLRGLAAEEATHDAAAVWSIPDFVYLSKVRKVSSGSRELGDRILIVGDLGIVVQVKSREALTSDPAKERRWIEKQIRRALAQANGTIRSLQREPERLTNARGREIEVDGNNLRWIVTVVIDHPEVPAGVSLGNLASPKRSIVLLRRDWEFLFNQLKSLHAVGEYLERVAGDPIELGDEPIRYYQLASADEQTPPTEIDPALEALGARQVSLPQLPMAPAAHEDMEAHLLVRVLFEDIATTRGVQMLESQRLKMLSELDRLPVGHREGIGRFLLNRLEDVERTPDDTLRWHLRRFVGGRGNAHLGFGVCSQYSPEIMNAFAAWVQLRHHELHLMMDASWELTTVGVLLTPRHDGQRPWDSTIIAASGDLGLTDEEVSEYRSVWKSDEEATLKS